LHKNLCAKRSEAQWTRLSAVTERSEAQQASIYRVRAIKGKPSFACPKAGREKPVFNTLAVIARQFAEMAFFVD
jgi:hypothetical protein